MHAFRLIVAWIALVLVAALVTVPAHLMIEYNVLAYGIIMFGACGCIAAGLIRTPQDKGESH